MKLGSSHTSSRTSIEEDYQPAQSTSRPMQSLRQRRFASENRNSLKAGDKESSETGGDGYAIWSRVATMASTLTVSVSKAWAANLTTSAGEETPPGQESRLTRVMKAYHLEKARDPSDLPPWLFDERERRRPAGHERTDAFAGRHERAQSVNDVSKARGLRDIYDAYRPEAPASRPSQRVFDDEPPPPSKTTDRLRALRDARRNAARAAPEPEGALAEATGDSRPRIGLPSGPRRL
ncbi:hypothetical protein LshimejAT787_0205570 [Lyophyllum shimeji]|uniref:Mso1 N-terminal domain-containing protein n=1 Tax=Lyophyllum shimeji TaxID=47721 RepID=A0A9P3UJ29_LYOSH|nr:hypothetical protein LshimejAT787_0205570 [Lyophyllum shimeji]